MPIYALRKSCPCKVSEDGFPVTLRLQSFRSLARKRRNRKPRAERREVNAEDVLTAWDNEPGLALKAEVIAQNLQTCCMGSFLSFLYWALSAEQASGHWGSNVSSKGLAGFQELRGMLGDDTWFWKPTMDKHNCVRV